MPIEDVSLRELLIVETLQADLDALAARCERLRRVAQSADEFLDTDKDSQDEMEALIGLNFAMNMLRPGDLSAKEDVAE